MTLDHVGNQEAMVHAQLGQQPLVRTIETSLEPRPGTRSCLSAQPLLCSRFLDGDTAPGGERVPEHCPMFLYSKRAAWTEGLVSRYGRSIVILSLGPLRDYSTTRETWNKTRPVRLS